MAFSFMEHQITHAQKIFRACKFKKIVENGGKKGLVKRHVWMTHGHGEQCGDWWWEQGVGWGEEGKGAKIGTIVIE